MPKTFHLDTTIPTNRPSLYVCEFSLILVRPLPYICNAHIPDTYNKISSYSSFNYFHWYGITA